MDKLPLLTSRKQLLIFIIAESVPLETLVGADVGEELVPSELISEDVAGEPQSVSTDAPVDSAVPEESVKITEAHLSALFRLSEEFNLKDFRSKLLKKQ
jgi:hypothetical protein